MTDLFRAPPSSAGADEQRSSIGRVPPRQRGRVRWSAAEIIGEFAAGRPLTPSVRTHQTRPAEASTYLRFARLSDIAIALIALLGLFVLDNLGHLPQGWGEFFNARLTVKNLGLLTLFAAFWHLAFRSMGLYDWSLVNSKQQEIRRLYAAAAIGTIVAFIFPVTSHSGAFRYGVILVFFIIASSSVLLARTALRIATRDRANRLKNIVIVGSGPRATQMYRRLCQDGSPRQHLLGFFDSNLQGSTEQDVVLRLQGSVKDLEGFLMQNPVDEVVIALPVKSLYADVQEAIQICERVGVPISYPGDVFTHVRTAPRFETHGPAPVFAFTHFGYGSWFGVKRAFDIVGALVGLVLFAPFMLIVALLIKATSPGPVFYVQERCGRNKRHFRMFKFRTMVEDAEVQQLELESRNEAGGPLFKIRFDPRVTGIGVFLRRSSIDELPQLWNVLRGDMSLVGPRPLPVRDVRRFSDSSLMRRFSVLPGLTGLWQVSGRSSHASQDDGIELDLAYIDRWSVWLDLQILLLTLPAVLSGKGAS